MLFAAIGWVLCVVMHCKLRKQESQSTQDLDLTEAAMVSQDHDNTEDANTPISSWFIRGCIYKHQRIKISLRMHIHVYTPITKITVISLIPSFKLEQSSTDVFERNKLQIVVFVSYNQKKKKTGFKRLQVFKELLTS